MMKKLMWMTMISLFDDNTKKVSIYAFSRFIIWNFKKKLTINNWMWMTIIISFDANTKKLSIYMHVGIFII